MTNIFKSLSSGIVLLAIVALSSCCNTEDPGPLQQSIREFSITDFDRLEMGSAFHITVEQADFFSVRAEGDVRNLNDLKVYKDGNTLLIKFDSNRNREHQTFITIRMPVLLSVNFSGASTSFISGFESNEDFDVVLSGASVSQCNINTDNIRMVVSGASNLTLRGEGNTMDATISGASLINTFNYFANDVILSVSGASTAKVMANDELHVTASGASRVYYRGDPVVISEVSGVSTVEKD